MPRHMVSTRRTRQAQQAPETPANHQEATSWPAEDLQKCSKALGGKLKALGGKVDEVKKKNNETDWKSLQRIGWKWSNS